MNDEKMFIIVQKVLTELLGHPAEDIKLDSHLTKDLGMDDIFAIRFMMGCEKELKITLDDSRFLPSNEIPADEMWRQKTVAEVVDFLSESIKKTEPKD